jgi:hypothetical protein
MIHEQRCNDDQSEDTTHMLHGLHAHVFNVQAVFLVKAIRMLDLRAITSLSIHRFGVASREDRHVGDQDQIAVEIGVVRDQGPQYLLLSRKPNLEPPQPDFHHAHFAGVSESYLKLQWQRHSGSQIVEQITMTEPLIPQETLQPLRHGLGRLSLSCHPSRHLRYERRLPAKNSLHSQFPYLAQSLLRQVPRNRFQELVQRSRQFAHRQLANRVILQYRMHPSALRSYLVGLHPKHTALGGVFKSLQHVGNHQLFRSCFLLYREVSYGDKLQ